MANHKIKKIFPSTRKERVSWYFYDWANSAFYTTVITVFLGPYLTGITKAAANSDGMINIIGLHIFYGSFFPYLVSLSVILQVLILPLIGAIADFTNKKKLLLGIFTYLGAFSTMGLYFLKESGFIFGGLLFILANLCFGAASVIYNSFLSDIAYEHQRDEVSSTGWAIGYIGGGLCLAINLVIFAYSDNLKIDKSLAVRINLALAGVWWGLFSLIPMKFLRKSESSNSATLNIISVGYKQLSLTFKDMLRYKSTLLFLIAYLLYNDGVQSVIVIASQFGKDELGIEISTLTQIILMVQFVGFLGSYLFNYLAKLMKTKTVILINLLIWSVAIFYAYMFLKDTAGFWLLSFVIGLVLGGIQALSRSLFSNLIPTGKTSEYFAFYEISDKGTSWLGPLIFGLSLQLSGSYRIAILSLLILLISGAVILFFTKINELKTDM
ncbi:MAG: MFS transporter [Candidatus Kapabacteria bacterium]|nr:MFS transporter [Candidatus Kapabacteria bacterium]